ncbi:MAG: MAPEG family protein [Myxococcota bacterium]
MNLDSNPVFLAYVVSAAILGANLLVLANNTALSRARHQQVVNPEDTRLNAAAEVVFEGGNEATARYRRAHRNALENIPLFLITGMLLPLVGTPAPLAISLYAVFVVARLVHSVTYLLQLQPWRTASFVIGALDQLVLLGVIVVQVLRGGGSA